MTIQPGTDIGRYHILEQLGEGGMAVVYKAYDKRLENEVAVKVIHTERLIPAYRERALKRFQIEAKKMAALQHASIVKVMDYGEYEGVPYLVMEYLAGGSLKGWLGQPLPYEQALGLLLPIAEALAYAHEKGLIHRDIKPSNILITEKGRPMLSDFGVAKVLEGEETLDLTSTGMGVGTPEYMAPEQAEGKPVDARADIYALGVVLYELVTGRKPFVADTPMAVLVKHIRDPLPRPGQYAPDLPAEVEGILFKALAKDAGERYQGMGEMAGAMSRVSASRRAGVEEQPLPAAARARAEPAPLPASALPKEGKNFSILLYALVGALALALVVFFLANQAGQRPSAMEPTNTSIPTPADQPAAAAAKTSRTQVSPVDGMLMVYVPAGTFLRGSVDADPMADDDEKPRREIYLDAFWIDQTEVSNAQYALCVADGACYQPANSGSYTRASYYGDPHYDDYPVIFVSWEDADAYCRWAGRRLPSEAEWEKAARGTDGRAFPWGDDFDGEKLNFCDVNCEFDWRDNRWDDGYADTAPVGSYQAGASPYGALDMAGNVLEWTADRYEAGYYQRAPDENPPGPSPGGNRVLRGGSWGSYERYVRAAFRGWSGSPIRHNRGFRCAQSP